MTKEFEATSNAYIRLTSDPHCHFYGITVYYEAVNERKALSIFTDISTYKERDKARAEKLEDIATNSLKDKSTVSKLLALLQDEFNVKITNDNGVLYFLIHEN